MADGGGYLAPLLEFIVGLVSNPVITATLAVVCTASLVLWICSCLRRPKYRGEQFI